MFQQKEIINFKNFIIMKTFLSILLFLSISVCVCSTNIRYEDTNEFIKVDIYNNSGRWGRVYKILFTIESKTNKKIKDIRIFGYTSDYVNSIHGDEPSNSKKKCINALVTVKTPSFNVFLTNMYKKPYVDLFGLEKRINGLFFGPTDVLIDSVIVYYANGGCSTLLGERKRDNYCSSSNNPLTTQYFCSKETIKYAENRILEDKKHEEDETSIIIFLIFCFSLIIIFAYILNINNKQEEEELKHKQWIDDIKETYLRTKTPILLGKTILRTTQRQTTQMFTDALIYAQPKEYSLNVNITNISDKIVTAVEIEVKTLNAFNEEISSFIVSKNYTLLFGRVTEYSWDLKSSFDVNNSITKVKRVMFKDGTIWNNN